MRHRLLGFIDGDVSQILTALQHALLGLEVDVGAVGNHGERGLCAGMRLAKEVDDRLDLRPELKETKIRTHTKKFEAKYGYWPSVHRGAPMLGLGDPSRIFRKMW